MKSHFTPVLIVTALCLLCGQFAFASTFKLSEIADSPVKFVRSEPGDTLNRVAKRYGVDYQTLKNANPDVPERPRAWTLLSVPFIGLPPGPREGIVINTADQKLYYFPKGEDVVMIFPVGVGKYDTPTPIGKTRVIGKQKDPTWHPPKSIRERLAAKGVELPDVVLPGEDNPLGKYALRLAVDHGQILIHGTDAPWSIGMRASSGCIRMHNDHVKQLYDRVKVNTPVWIINDEQLSMNDNGRVDFSVRNPSALELNPYQ